MIGVKAPMKRGAPRPEKSAKKKKLLKETSVEPDTSAQDLATTMEDKSTVIKNPYVQYELPVEMPPLPASKEDDEATHLERVIKKVREQTDENEKVESPSKELEQYRALPRMMKIRYEELLEKVHPRELKDGEKPHLSWLEQHYGHLVSKRFWYDRFVKLAAAYCNVCPDSEDVWEKELNELEKVVGHLVPFTDAEKEFQELYKYYERDHWKIDGPVSLEFLRGRYASDGDNQEAYEAGDEAGDDSQTSGDDDRYVRESCPLHEDEVIKCLNPDDEFRCAFFKCSRRDCPVFFTTDTKTAVYHQILHAIHPTIREQLIDGSLKCHCDFTPNMKLSQSKKNFNRVYLTCRKKNAPCTFFQFIHWKPRPKEGPLDGFIQKAPKVQRFARSEAIECIPSELHRQQKKQGFCVNDPCTQQLVATGLDRFKKDDVFLGRPEKPNDVFSWKPSHLFGTYPGSEWKNGERVVKTSGRTTHGFVPDPNYQPPFQRGIHMTEADIARKRFGPGWTTGSCLF